MDNLGDIFDYCNEDLLDGELDSLSDILGSLNEAQNIVSQVSPVEAPLVATVLDTACTITLPTNLAKVKEFRLLESDGTTESPIEPIKDWAGVVYFNTYYSGRTINLYYYKKPTTLTAVTSQVPDVDSLYWYAMAQYVASVWKLKDDDESMKRQLEEKFISGLSSYSRSKNVTRNFRNVW